MLYIFLLTLLSLEMWFHISCLTFAVLTVAGMGCTMTTQNGLLMQRDESSATRIFKVTNVDNNGEDRNPGYIEITADSLVLHQRDKESVAWPLHGLRRYGFDADLFSFESGRRCPTGPGIYAFRCRRAEALFNLLQSSIVVAGQSNAAAAATHRAGGGLVESARRRSALHGAATVQPSNQLMFLQPVAVVRPLRPQMTLSQYRNIPVNGHTVPHPEHVERQSLAQLPDILAMYRTQPEPAVHYAELDLDRHVDDEESADDDDVDIEVFAAADEQLTTRNRTEPPPLYVNMSTGSHPATVRHGYANVDLIADSTTAAADAAAGLTKMNYIQLDLSTETLDEGSTAAAASPAATRTLSLTQNADIARGTVDGYTTIDFDKTRALNTISVESLGIADEGVRRTRHNSNII